MLNINVYGAPPTVEAIQEARRAVSRETSDMAFKVGLFTPIPGLDLLAALATEAVGDQVKGKTLAARAGAVDQDWSESPITQRYVDEVRAQGRELIEMEMTALEHHLAMERPARAATGAVIDTILTKSGEAIGAAAETSIAAVTAALGKAVA